MKHQLSTDTNNALEIVGSVLHKVTEGTRWIGGESYPMDKKEVQAFVLGKLARQKHIKARKYEDRLRVEIGLSGDNLLDIDF